MPTELTTTITKFDVCPDFVIQNTTSYPSGTSHDESNFNTFVKLNLQLPNSMSLEFTPDSPTRVVNTPAQNYGRAMQYATCLVGKFIVDYIALPTPPEQEVEGQSPLYYNEDNFYYNGVIYLVNAVSISLPAEGFTNAELIADYLSQGFISIISEDDINSKYRASIMSFHWCNLLKCLKDKLSKINCLIVKEPTRTDICEMEDYETVLQLNYLYYFLSIANIEDLTPSVLYELEVISNYVNSKCCCGKGGKCC